MKDDTKQLKQALTRNLKAHRSKLKLTQEEAAEKAGIAVKYWQRLEMISQGDLPSLPTLKKISKALKTTPSDLLK